jgi:segregation and condensation protein B
LKFSELEAAAEAVLFASGDAVPLARLQKALELPAQHIRQIMARLRDYYDDNSRGLRVIEIDDSFQLCTRGRYSEYISRLANNPAKKTLSPALMETLAIVAYKQPVTKSQIEELRGVNADHAVNKLVEYGLVTEKGRLDAPGRPLLFATGDDFLRQFGYKSIKELPSLEDGAQMEIKA